MDMCFFCFKQKTAYEMRISDWSSDVCSSDLRLRAPAPGQGARQATPGGKGMQRSGCLLFAMTFLAGAGLAQPPSNADVPTAAVSPACPESRPIRPPLFPAQMVREKRGGSVVLDLERSEEHASELQSLMRISYAVFCLKKKNSIMRQKNNAQKYEEKHNI